MEDQSAEFGECVKRALRKDKIWLLKFTSFLHRNLEP